jgi:hypothetical protein
MPKEVTNRGNVVKIQVEAKNPPKKRARAKAASQGIPKALIENFVALQKVQTNLAEKLNNLSTQISQLLKLFESAAKSLSEQPAVQICGKDKELLEKLNQLLEQDKVIAKGIVYIEDRMNEMSPEARKTASLEEMEQSPQAPPAPSPEKTAQTF